ncbi:hypothetical protein GGS20DRAFT_203336 [Poronia punctata]|nr:hypothetical protein GGS20DRAFT_203336 [Poronia punctata]
MGFPALPQDIMLLICQELGGRQEFATLYNCSLTSRRLAGIAIEQLYSTIGTYIEDKHQATCLWRSIILSSLGATLYPYCAYIRALSLSGLIECLEDIRNDQPLRDFFFGGLMQDFLGTQGGDKGVRAHASRQQIQSRCVDSITKYIKNLADNNGSSVALTHLEATTLPREILPVWIRRLATLKVLQLQDGSILDGQAANVIAECCPRFAELICFHCSSDTAAEDMAAFFSALRPNSLRRFEMLSRNTLGDATLSALSSHAKSLRALNLRSLPSPLIKKLGLLSECTALESLIIEKEATATSEVDALSEEELAQVAAWIGKCKALRELNFAYVRDAMPILRHVLREPDIRLELLAIHEYVADFEFEEAAREEAAREAWRALGRQDKLTSLTIASQTSSPDGLMLELYPELADSICQLSNLTSLNLMQAWVTAPELVRLVAALPRLEALSFGGGLFTSSILQPLSTLRNLVSLSINAATAFRFEHLVDFAQSLDPVGNSGIRVDLLYQWSDYVLTAEEEEWLDTYFQKTLKGRIVISYPNEPFDPQGFDVGSDDSS